MRCLQTVLLAVAFLLTANSVFADSWAFRKDASDQHGSVVVTTGRAAAFSIECLRPGFNNAAYGRANGQSDVGISRPGIVALVAEGASFPGAIQRAASSPRLFITVTVDGQNQFFREAIWKPRRRGFVAELHPGDAVIMALRAGGVAQIRVQGEMRPVTVRLGGSGQALGQLQRYCGTPI